MNAGCGGFSFDASIIPVDFAPSYAGVSWRRAGDTPPQLENDTHPGDIRCQGRGRIVGSHGLTFSSRPFQARLNERRSIRLERRGQSWSSRVLRTVRPDATTQLSSHKRVPRRRSIISIDPSSDEYMTITYILIYEVSIVLHFRYIKVPTKHGSNNSADGADRG
jgi:hypothetical protein